LHRLIYPAAVLVCWHFWWQVKKDWTEPAVYAAILGTLLGIRLWRQLRRRGAASPSGVAAGSR
jgi:sulfoxide reductase heme-binding subunit YedZ